MDKSVKPQCSPGHGTEPEAGRAHARRALDATDRKILAALQDDGRLTNVEIADIVGMTPSPALRRTRDLEDQGYIRGYHARLDNKRLGYPVTAYVAVGLRSQAKPDLRAFEERLAGWPTVRECYALSGEMDFLLRCVARDLESFQSFVSETLLAVPNVQTVKSALVMRSDHHMMPLFSYSVG